MVHSRNESGRSTVIPTLRYRDAPAAIEWLCSVFGFEKHLVVVGEDGRTVEHAQLVLGGGMLMLGSTDRADSDYARHVRQPDEVGGFETQSPYLVVPDADAVHARVKSNGGQIVIDIHDEDYGGRGFGCRDPQGRFWYVGTYDPWA